MQTIFRQLLITGFALLSTSPLFAQTPTPPNTHPAATLQKKYCPTISELKKDPIKLTWSVGYNWKSYETSFANKIVAFYGAQWVGANVGQITCIYKGEPQSFLIFLIYNTLTLEPTQESWSKNLGGYRNCNAHETKQCPFLIRLKPIHQDLFKELQEIKKQPPTQNNSGE